MRNYLKEYIRRLIEVAVSGEQATESGLALCRGQRSGNVLYVLYDPNVLVDELQKPGFFSMRFSRPLGQIILGFISAQPHSGDCNDALEIKMSAAEKGYGPLLYDIAMSDGDGGLMSDRISTSDQAKRVWQHYGSKRGDVKKVPFDDVENPKTSNDGDDCVFVKDEDNVLNYSYDGPGQSGSKSHLLNRHDEIASKIAQHGIKKQQLESILINIGQIYFDKKYGK